jgi:two-component system, sensor histidine kinase and response regulator
MSEENQSSILVVDDEPLILDMVQEMLMMEGYKTILANSAEEALELLDSRTLPNLIISDINMPGMNGFEFYQEVQKRKSLNVVPFIFLSALYDQPNVWHGKELGVDDYLMKPFTREDLLATIRGKLKKAERLVASLDAEVSAIKGKILQMLSHEFRTPLTTIIGFSSVLSDDSTNLSPEELKTFMELIKRGGDRLQNLVEDFLESVSVETGDMINLYDSLKCNFDIKNLVDESISAFEMEKKDKNIEIEFTIPDDRPPVFGYSSQIQNIIKRMVSNSIKFSRENGKVQISIEPDGEYLNVIIKDNGIGIPREEIPKIYEKFYQIKRDKYEQQGSGLGLFIAKKLADINKCKILCESVLQQSTIFTIKIPTTQR